MHAAFDLSRRRLLQGGAGLLVGFTLPVTALRAAGTPEPAIGQPKDFKEVSAWLALDPDGRATIYSGHVELGTGVETALTQMAAEELDLPFDAVHIVQGDTLLTPDQGPTWGSLSIQAAGLQLRQAAACARRALLQAAAKELGQPQAGLRVADGVISAGGKQVSYADLARARALDVAFDKDVPLKRPADFKLIGKSQPRVDIPGKVTGGFTYMQDFRVPGMLHGRVIRPAAMEGHLRSMDDSAARRIPGYIKTVVEGDFVGVVAETEWAAIRAMGAVKCTWSPWNGLPKMDAVYEAVRKTPLIKTEIAKKVGDAAGNLRAAHKVFKAAYEFPVQTHGSIGPSCSVADVRDGEAIIWSASQSTHWLQRQIAAMLKMAPEKVRILYLEGAGCYGRNGHEDASADAVMLSRAMHKPVRVQWMRADEHGWDPKSPPYVAELQGALNEEGQIIAWDFQTWIPNGSSSVDVPLLAHSLQDHDVAVQTPDNMNPGNMQSDAFPPYEVPNLLARVHRTRTTPFRPSWLRSPGRMQNTYANECFMDELAAAAGADPVAFRLQHLKDDRGAACIRACAVKAGWTARPSPRKQAQGDVVAGRGFTYVFYDNKRTYVAAVCDVEVNRKTGKVRATRFVIAHDCGLVINPDGTRAQIEGSVVQTTSRTLVEELTWDDSHVTSLDWVGYPILTFPEVPEIEVVLLDHPEKPAWGAGEPTCAVVPSAISNAIFDATGVRMRQAPFTPDRVKAALRT